MVTAELLITDGLLQKGVPSSEIVLGFKLEYARQYTGFGVA